MKLEVDTSQATVAKISLTVPADEFETQVRQGGLRNVGGNVRMKGFRPGKVPAKVLEKQFGEGIRKEVKEHFVQQAYGQAVQENGLKPIAPRASRPRRWSSRTTGPSPSSSRCPSSPGSTCRTTRA